MQNQPNHSFQGIWVPKEILEDENLSGSDTLLLSVIHSLNGENGCWASNEYLAKIVKVSERTIKRRLQHLKDLDYISITIEDGYKRTIKTHMGYVVKNKSYNGKKAKKQDQNELEDDGHDDTGGGHADQNLPTRDTLHDNKIDNTPLPPMGEARVDKKFDPPEAYEFLRFLELRDTDKMRLMRFPAEKVRNAVGWAIENYKKNGKLIAGIIYAINNDLDPENKMFLYSTKKEVETRIDVFNRILREKGWEPTFEIEGDEVKGSNTEVVDVEGKNMRIPFVGRFKLRKFYNRFTMARLLRELEDLTPKEKYEYYKFRKWNEQQL